MKVSPYLKKKHGLQTETLANKGKPFEDLIEQT